MGPRLPSKRRAFVWFAMLLASLVGCAAVPPPDDAGKFMDDTVIFNRLKASILNGPSLGSDAIAVDTSKRSVGSDR